MPINPHVYGFCNFTSISVGRHIYVIGDSLFDTRSFSIDRPSPSSAIFRFDLAGFRWDRLSPMLNPRGSFACVAIGPGSGFAISKPLATSKNGGVVLSVDDNQLRTSLLESDTSSWTKLVLEVYPLGSRSGPPAR